MSQRNRRGSEVVSEDGGSLTPGERLQTNSSWGYFYEQPDSSSGAFENSVTSTSSSTAETAGTRLSSRHTISVPYPQLPHIRPETSNVTRHVRNSSRSSHRLRLTLPPPQIIDMFGVAIPTTLLDRKTENEGNGVGGVPHDQQRFRQSLLGIAFPTTPDTSLNNMPVLCGGNGRDGRGLDSAEGGIGIAHEIMMGGAAAALLAANPHLAPGSLALLTPPDDSGVIEWRREEASSDVIVPVGIQSVRKPPPIQERFDSEAITGGDNSRKRVAGIKRFVDNLDTATPSTKKNENDGEEAGEKSRSVKRDAVSEKDDPSVDKPAKDDKDSPGLPGFAEDGWLGNAMAALCLSPPPIFPLDLSVSYKFRSCDSRHPSFCKNRFFYSSDALLFASLSATQYKCHGPEYCHININKFEHASGISCFSTRSRSCSWAAIIASNRREMLFQNQRTQRIIHTNWINWSR